MKVLVIKTSSMGDVLHTLPALTDAGNQLDNVRFDWVVEKSFAEIPKWHPLVDRVIPISLRRWRQRPLTALKADQFAVFFRALRSKRYDYLIDAQGLLKSACITWLARGVSCGYDRVSAREPWAAWLYRRRYHVDKTQHAVTRIRQLFAQCLRYVEPTHAPDYGIPAQHFTKMDIQVPYVIFIHGTTWSSKMWHLSHWVALAEQISAAGFMVYLPWGNEEEYQRAQAIAKQCPTVQVLPKLSLKALASYLVGARAAVAVDTGLGHLSAALNVPTVSLYGPTDPKKIGTLGRNQVHLTAPFECIQCGQKQCTYPGGGKTKPVCFGTMEPHMVWDQLKVMVS